MLLVSAIGGVPWQSATALSVLWGIIGLSGISYSIIVAGRMQVQSAYKPVLEDWMFHVILPFGSYASLGGAAVIVHSHSEEALYVVAGADLVLLFVGIHNAWDAVTYHVFVRRRQKPESVPSPDEAPKSKQEQIESQDGR